MPAMISNKVWLYLMKVCPNMQTVSNVALKLQILVQTAKPAWEANSESKCAEFFFATESTLVVVFDWN